MFPFSFTKAADEDAALAAGASGGYIAGGTTLVDLMRETVERPESVVDINALPWALTGRPPSAELWLTAGARAADGAKPLSENGFKVELVKRTVGRQLAAVAGQS